MWKALKAEVERGVQSAQSLFATAACKTADCQVQCASSKHRPPQPTASNQQEFKLVETAACTCMLTAKNWIHAQESSSCYDPGMPGL